MQLNKKILYIRSGPYELKFDSYNLQEIGLGSAFCKEGYDFDLLYYSKEDKDQIIEVGDKRIKILWRRGIKILRTGIYPQILKQSFLEKYDIVIVSEYSQLMSILVSKLHKNTYIYNGPYYNMFKIPFMEKIYDFLFVKYINKNVVKIFSKTEKAKQFLESKGINNIEVVGVGLDTTKFDNEKSISDKTEQVINRMKDKRNLLYVGAIIKRKNIELILKAFNELKKEDKYKDVQLILIGKGDERYITECFSLLNEEAKKSIVYQSFISNSQLKFVYEKSDIFLLPSFQEIFGMVMLEAMYFGVPAISSKNGGSTTLIKNNVNGIIIDNFDCYEWCDKISQLLNDYTNRVQMGNEAKKTILDNFTWKSITHSFIDNIK